MRFVPVNPIPAFGITDHFRLGLPQRWRVDDVAMAAIIHAVQLAVLNHRRVPAGVALPGLVEFQGDFAGHGVMQLQRELAVQSLRQRIVDEEFPARTQLDRLGPVGRGGQYQAEDECRQ